MLAINQLPYVADLDDEIDREQAAMGITLAPEQRQAVKTALSYPLCIISGYYLRVLSQADRAPARPCSSESF